MHARRRLLIGCLVLLVAGRAVGTEPSKDHPTKEQLDRLLKAYLAYELPFPPADAPLVVFPIHVWSGGRQLRALGFQLKPATEGGPARAFWALGEIQELDRREVARPVEPRPEALNEVERGADYVFAIHCQARGWTELALKALEKSDPAWAGRDLPRSACAYWEARVLDPGSDRIAIARRLKVVLKDLGKDEAVDRDLPRALELAAAPGRGKPGTVEAAIDRLVDVTSTDNYMVGMKLSPHPAYAEVAHLGFDAVPALLEHLSDDRATRTRPYALNGNPGSIYRVRDLARDLLEEFAEPGLGKLKHEHHKTADLERWWTASQRIGEKRYCVDHVLDRTEPHARVNWALVQVLRHKYPECLPEVYRRMADDRPNIYGSALAKAVAESSLPKETKRDLFVHAASSKSWHHRRDATEQLKAIDREAASKAIVVAIQDLPTMSPELPDPLDWVARWLADEVVESNNPKAWAALGEEATKWPLTRQREAIAAMDRDDDATRSERLRFLSQFFDRFDVWKTATRTAGRILGLRKPMDWWTEHDWEDLITDIRAVLAREKIR